MGLHSDSMITTFKFSPSISSGLRLLAAIEGVSLQETSGEALSEFLKHSGKDALPVIRPTRARVATSIEEAAKTIVSMKLTKNDIIPTKVPTADHKALGQLAMEAGERMNALVERGAILLLQKKGVGMAKDVAGLTSETARKKAMSTLSKIAQGKAAPTDFFNAVTPRKDQEWWESQPNILFVPLDIESDEPFAAFLTPSSWMPDVIEGVVVTHIPARKSRERPAPIIIETAEPASREPAPLLPDAEWGLLSAEKRPKPVLEATVVSPPATPSRVLRSPTAWRAPDTRQKADGVFKNSKRKGNIPRQPVSANTRETVKLNRPKLSLAVFRKPQHT